MKLATRRALAAVADAARAVADAALAVALAPECLACARPLEHPSAGPVCAACWASIAPLLPPWCSTCGDPLPSWRTISIAASRCAACRRRPQVIAAGRTAGTYDGVLRDVIHALKYDGHRSLARPIAAMMRESGAEILAGADLLVPVPLHPWRRMRRGFNQAGDLARRLDLPVVSALWRVRLTATQTGLSAAARRRNVRGAFRISPLLARASRERLRGRVVVLIDDVRTTGATLDACARMLRDAAGVREVRALTAARAPLRVRT